MHETARRGLQRVLTGAGVLLLLILGVVFGLRSCTTEEERVSQAVDDARDALVERRAEDFLSFFAEDLHYRKKDTRKELERDLRRWMEARIGRIAILERTITVNGDQASIRLRCDVGNVLQTYLTVDVDLTAEKVEDRWLVKQFDWK